MDSNQDREQGPLCLPMCSCLTSCMQKNPNNGHFNILQVSFYLSLSSTQATSMNKSCLKKKTKKKNTPKNRNDVRCDSPGIE